MMPSESTIHINTAMLSPTSAMETEVVMFHAISPTTSTGPSPLTSTTTVTALPDSRKSLPKFPSTFDSLSLPSQTSTVARPTSTSALNISFQNPNLKRDPTLADKPDHLPFASAAFAELHRRRALNAQISTSGTVSAPPTLAVQVPTTRPSSPSPPPLPPKPESLQFPNGERVRASSISHSFTNATLSLPDVNPWPFQAPPTPTSKSSVSNLFFKNIKSKILKRMTLPIRSAPDQRNQPSRTRRSRLLRSKKSAISYLDPYSSDDYDEDHFAGFGHAKGEYPAESYQSPAGALVVESGHASSTDDENGTAVADDDAESVIIHYAEHATFQRPVIVHCSSSPPVRPSNFTVTEIQKVDPEPDLWLELGKESGPFDPYEEKRSSYGEDFYKEAEERLERRLAEDRAREMRFLRIEDSDNDGGEEVGEGEVHWSEVVYDDSIVDEHLALHLDNDNNMTSPGGNHNTESREVERPSSAMSELDLLVRDSLVIAQRSELLTPPDWSARLESKQGKKRKVSFTIEEADCKRVASMGPSTPYPFGMLGGEEDGKEDEVEVGEGIEGGEKGAQELS